MTEQFSITGQFVRFAGIGIIGTFAQYLILVVLVQLIKIEAVFASGLGFIVGALVNYYLNYIYTFRSTKRHHEAMIKFFTVALVGLVLNSFIMAVATHILQFYYLLSQLIATGLVLIWNFAGNRLWTFKEKTHAKKC